MNLKGLSVPKWAGFVTFALITGVLGFSCGSGGSNPPPIPSANLGQALSAGDAACSDRIFFLGRPLGMNELTSAGQMSFELREVHFRDAFLRSPNDVELAYRASMKMVLQPDRSLRPVHTLACNVLNKPSARSLKMATTTIPVLGDLHLPSTRITVYDEASAESDLYNFPRISGVTFSNGPLFLFSQPWMDHNPRSRGIQAKYRATKTLSQYLNILKYQEFYSRVEIREMGDGWLGIYAERSNRGERAQLMVLLARTN
ncbi:MAG: hypothetical protein JST04_08630 [Bdellovibrionales bacterium]|nr:hypothetical protein [Bdellovibrionales bacterium]